MPAEITEALHNVCFVKCGVLRPLLEAQLKHSHMSLQKNRQSSHFVMLEFVAFLAEKKIHNIFKVNISFTSKYMKNNSWYNEKPSAEAFLRTKYEGVPLF